jgi:arylsulfatase A-like enzyme
MRRILLAIVLMASAANAADRKPNIVFILADDLGWTDVACQGSKYYESPNIDQLARDGMRFTNGYTCAPNCAPTRAALMSGQYEPRTGIYTVGSIDRFNWRSRPLRPVDNVTELPKDKITVADALKRAGYATAMFGKWHLGRGEYHPSHRGFDEAIVSEGQHFNFKTDPPTPYPNGQYLADFLTDHAVDFIKRHAGRGNDQPFFLYLPHFAVHSPIDAKPELIAKFKDKPPVDGQKNPTYAAMIASVDESVGRVVATLEELKLTNDTIVIFSSDNGGVGGYHRAGVDAWEITDNAPLRGGKGMLYEGGVRVPFIFKWPGKIAAGKVSDEPIISIDMYPTFLEIAGAARPENYPLDGVSFLPTLFDSSHHVDRDALYWHFPGYLGANANDWRTTPGGAIRVGDFKLLEYFEDNHVELYNLKDDLSQQHDLAQSDPDKAKQLHAKLVAWRESMHAKMPTPNTPEPNAKKPKKGGEE